MVVVLRDQQVLKVYKVLLVHKVVVVLRDQTGTQGTTGQKGTTGSNAGITTYFNPGNHRVITGTTTSTTITGESNLTFNGSTLFVNGDLEIEDSGDRGLLVDPSLGAFRIGDIDEVGGGAYINGDGDDIFMVYGGVEKFEFGDTGTLTAAADVIAYGSPSDIRLKENIKPIESALDKAMKLQGVTFDWKKSDSILELKEDVGFIAQDVQKVIPELVRENENGMLSMRHQGIAPILLEAIKELKAEIDLLKSKPCNCNCNCKCSK